ncbi:MAG: sensor histidine kinase [Clostridia bacterium]|nr:sensor histidine kinase [Clostridia bacterium]
MPKLRIVHRLANMSIRSRLLLYFVMFFIIPIIMIGVISYSVSLSIIKERAVDFSSQTVKRVTDETEKILLEAHKIAVMIANDPTIQEPLRIPQHEDISDRFSTDLKTDSRLSFIESYSAGFYGFYVIGQNGGKYKSNYCSIKDEDLRKQDWFRKIINSSGPVWFGIHTDSYAVETAGQSFISVGLRIVDKASGQISGVVLIDIAVERFTEVTKDSKLGKTGYMFVVDEKKNEVQGRNDKLVSQTLNEMEKKYLKSDRGATGYFVESFGEKSIVIYNTSLLTGWKTIGIVPMNELTKDSRELGYIIAVLTLMICVFAILSAWYNAATVANPIRKLMLLMKKVEDGDLSVSMNVKYDDEIGRLGRSFNVMIQKIGTLMERVYKEQKELRKAELKALQAQINPHFLYNTLDSIIWMVRANRNEEVIKMVTSLTKLFRIGISRGKDIITIKEEIEHINSYLTIQNIRYKSKFDYEVKIDESLYRYKTLKLILQPLVENAIYHGIKEKRGQGFISITSREEEKSIVLKVEDDGIGMTEEKIGKLKNTLSNSGGETMDSYGVRNVDERIKIFFGSEYGLVFESKPGVGTRVEVTIPKLSEVEDVVKGTIG